MTRDRARLILQRHQEALNRHDVAGLAALYAEDAVLESPMFATVRGRVAIRASFHSLFELFPDYSVTMRDPLFICEGDRAAEFSTVKGTQRGALFGLPATGEPIEYHAARLFTFRDELIEHEQRIYDFGGVLERFEKIRVDRELATASAVQDMLMAQPTVVGGFFEVVRASLPCRAISGDFLAYHDVPTVGFGLALGDVSGKGPPAALVAAMLQGMLSMSTRDHAAPDALLHRLNVGLRNQHVEGRYATMCCAVLTPDGRLTYANAGHPPPLLVTARGTRTLTEGGPILGVFEDATFPAETLQLSPGDRIVVYSDGVTEAAAPNGDEFGLDRLVTAAAAHATSRPAALVEGVLSAVRAFSDTAASVDDATIAVLTFRARNMEL
jgi:sigma-B regulation protein RsbU (phosphoserine phosphatase)